MAFQDFLLNSEKCWYIFFANYYMSTIIISPLLQEILFMNDCCVNVFIYLNGLNCMVHRDGDEYLEYSQTMP